MEKLEKLVEYYKNNKLAHSYLIETDDIEQTYGELKNIIKQINCPNDYCSNCSNCNICHLIDNNCLPSFLTITKDGQNIKKEQIIDLKQKFMTKPVFTKNNIYVIKEAEKLNGSSANTMLKFIEEPDDNIIGFFITNNVNNVISTIKSRCEIISIKYHNQRLIDNKYLNVSKEYLNVIVQDKYRAIVYNKENILSNYKEREDIKKIIEAMLYVDGIENINNLKKNKIITKYLENIYFNVNLELFLDNLVIELSDINE